ncbi:MAG: class I SAM-dependent methyltransferase [Candidatus Daviesbacteria bacterium]|nr:MAG: class I SAM-dependent methyltransferase [Candidatus Daviesbacteria bacterium]
MTKPKEKTLTAIWQQVPADYYDQGMQNNFLQFIWHRQKWTFFRKLMEGVKFKLILDVGCASGTFTNRLTELFPQAKIYGVDAYSSAIKFAQKKYPHLNFLKADAHQLPFKQNSFDLVICYETIEHVVDPLQVLRQMHRILKKDGLAILAMDSGNLMFRTIWWFWGKTKGRVWEGAHLHPFHHDHLEEIVQKSGFKIQQKKFSHFGMEVVFVLKK